MWRERGRKRERGREREEERGGERDGGERERERERIMFWSQPNFHQSGLISNGFLKF